MNNNPNPQTNLDPNRTSFLDYCLFILASILIISGIYILFFVLKELYIVYTNVGQNTFLSTIMGYLTMKPLNPENYFGGVAGWVRHSEETATKAVLLSFTILFVLATFTVTVGQSMIKLGVSILPKKNRTTTVESKQITNPYLSTPEPNYVKRPESSAQQTQAEANTFSLEDSAKQNLKN